MVAGRSGELVPAFNRGRERLCAVSDLRLKVRNGKAVEVCERRIHDVVVTVPEVTARRSPSQDEPSVAIFVDG
jgi:hypothetical protein